MFKLRFDWYIIHKLIHAGSSRERLRVQIPLICVCFSCFVLFLTAFSFSAEKKNLYGKVVLLFLGLKENPLERF